MGAVGGRAVAAGVAGRKRGGGVPAQLVGRLFGTTCPHLKTWTGDGRRWRVVRTWTWGCWATEGLLGVVSMVTLMVELVVGEILSRGRAHLNGAPSAQGVSCRGGAQRRTLDLGQGGGHGVPGGRGLTCWVAVIKHAAGMNRWSVIGFGCSLHLIRVGRLTGAVLILGG